MSQKFGIFQHNAGLYTGEPFEKNAPWANVKVRPTAAYLNHVNLLTAQPPVEALYQMQYGYRPGNNTDDRIPGLKRTQDNIYCIPLEVEKRKPDLRKYKFIDIT